MYVLKALQLFHQYLKRINDVLTPLIVSNAIEPIHRRSFIERYQNDIFITLMNHTKHVRVFFEAEK